MTPEQALIEKLAKALMCDVDRNGKPMRLPDAERDHLWATSAMKPYMTACVRSVLTALAEAGCTEGMAEAGWNCSGEPHDRFKAMILALVSEEETK